MEASALVPLRVPRWARIKASLSTKEWRRAGYMAAVIVGLHVIGFGILLLVVAEGRHKLGTGTFALGTGITAYTLGMRHAFDADHISAIDNTTRKLMGEGQRPLSVGFFFSLGHSTVVFALAFLLAIGVRTLGSAVENSHSALHQVTSVIGTSVSGAFLYIIAFLNIVVLVRIVGGFFAMRRGSFDEEEMARKMASLGLMNRFFGRRLARIHKPVHIYPVGVLFGLGFDTATEIALLALAGSAGASHLPFYAIICLPVLFAAGMCLLDTIDGSFMNFAYGWAFSQPVRKVYYNITITGLSILVALLIGTIELGGLLSAALGLHGFVAQWLQNFNINAAGYLIVGLFVVTWLFALVIWHVGGIERKWAAGMKHSGMQG